MKKEKWRNDEGGKEGRKCENSDEGMDNFRRKLRIWRENCYGGGKVRKLREGDGRNDEEEGKY